jgi:hypothetical protein
VAKDRKISIHFGEAVKSLDQKDDRDIGKIKSSLDMWGGKV